MYGSTSQKPLENTSVKHHLGINYHFNGNISFGKGKFHIQNIAVKLSFWGSRNNFFENELLHFWYQHRIIWNFWKRIGYKWFWFDDIIAGKNTIILYFASNSYSYLVIPIK